MEPAHLPNEVQRGLQASLGLLVQMQGSTWEQFFVYPFLRTQGTVTLKFILSNTDSKRHGLECKQVNWTKSED